MLGTALGIMSVMLWRQGVRLPGLYQRSLMNLMYILDSYRVKERAA